jgi:outer membrane receptor protein involved in Fe transport
LLIGALPSAIPAVYGDFAQAQTTNPVTPLPTIDVQAPDSGQRTFPSQTTAASEQDFSGDRINAQPASRTGEFLEATPGLIVTQHSGEGKANQYFLRGFNLDHGTDLAITVDGMPVNMRTHGHGQGYADTNFIIPELIQSMRVRKGPYYADEGDFSSAGSLSIGYAGRLDKKMVALTYGSFGSTRTFAAGSTRVGNGNVLAAFEGNTYNGPWDTPDKVRKINGVMRYSEGTNDAGLSLTAMAYANSWNATDQVAQRAVDQNLIGRYGTLDPTDGGKASRYSLSGRWSRADDKSASRVEAYGITSTLALFNNFTYFLDDPVNGDQFSQTDRRSIFGLNASHTFKGRFGNADTATTVGFQGRYDDISVGLVNTLQRVTLSTTRQDKVQEGSTGLYVQNTTQWNTWFRTIAGLRGDWYKARDASDNPLNSGNVRDSIASPKFGVVFGPFNKTEFYLSGGNGFHSNDVRGTVITVDPKDPTVSAERVPLLVRSQGAEIGIRTRAIANLESTLSLFVLDFASELLFVGDAGTTEPSRPSRRVGIEWTNNYRLASWLTIDADLAMTRARFTNDDPAGDRIPGAPNMVASAGFTVGQEVGWFGGMKLRYFGPRPLIEDNSVKSSATALVNARVGYRYANGVRVQLDAFNLFDSHASQIDYYYTSRLQGEPAGGVADRHFHPVEPLAVRLTVAANF